MPHLRKKSSFRSALEQGNADLCISADPSRVTGKLIVGYQGWYVGPLGPKRRPERHWLSLGPHVTETQMALKLLVRSFHSLFIHPVYLSILPTRHLMRSAVETLASHLTQRPLCLGANLFPMSTIIHTIYRFSKDPADGGYPVFDFWPDLNDYPESELYPVPSIAPSGLLEGANGKLFSSANPATVSRHFRQLAAHGVDGVFFQRWGNQCLVPASVSGRIPRPDSITSIIAR